MGTLAMALTRYAVLLKIENTFTLVSLRFLFKCHEKRGTLHETNTNARAHKKETISTPGLGDPCFIGVRRDEGMPGVDVVLEDWKCP